uniref:TGF_BETA_2 domain-containing protein n=1 Tax=Caenorhabditis tropicalis TaxID=1561998 RepID=A0A1I7TSE2_9PELO
MEDAPRVSEEDTPQVSEEDTPQVSEEDTPRVSEEDTPQVSEEDTPRVSEEDTPQVSEEDTPRVSEEDAPQVSEEDTPRVSEEDTPQVSEEDTPQVSEEDTPRVSEEDTPRVSEEDTPRVSEEDTPQVSEEDTPRVVEEDTPRVVEEDTPRVVEEDAPRVVEGGGPLEEDRRSIDSGIRVIGVQRRHAMRLLDQEAFVRFPLLPRHQQPVLEEGYISNEEEEEEYQILETLDLLTRPPYLHLPPLIPYPVTVPKKHDLFSGILDKFTIEPDSKSWKCETPERTISDCFQFKIKSIKEEILTVSFVIQIPKVSNLSVILYEVDDLFGELRYLDRLEIKGFEEENYRFDITQKFKNWMKKRKRNRMIKIEMINSRNSLDILNPRGILDSPPHFEITVFRKNPKNSEDSGCHVIPFYVNFTEIGWNDWILSPPGFWSNYCSSGSSCSSFSESDETYRFLRSSMENPSSLPQPKCAPNHFGSVDMVVALNHRDIRKTRVHGLRALSCSCT